MTTVTDGSYRSRILGLLGDAGLARSYGPGKWTGKQILAHLADAELAIGFRTRQVLAEERHTIQPCLLYTSDAADE